MLTDFSIIPADSSSVICLTISTWLAVDWGRGGALFLGEAHILSSTINSKGGISAALYESVSLNISLKLLHKIRIWFCKSSSPDIWISERGSVEEKCVSK